MTGLLVAKLFVSMTCPALPCPARRHHHLGESNEDQRHPAALPTPGPYAQWAQPPCDACKTASLPQPPQGPGAAGGLGALGNSTLSPC